MFALSSGQNTASGPSRSQQVDFPALENSAKRINDQLSNDTRLIPDLKDLIAGNSSSTIIASA
jgi:hypothetical protein